MGYKHKHERLDPIGTFLYSSSYPLHSAGWGDLGQIRYFEGQSDAALSKSNNGNSKCTENHSYESCATIVLYRDVGMGYDKDKVDEMVLAFLYLTIWEEDVWGARA